jgi:hypothetical protein
MKSFALAATSLALLFPAQATADCAGSQPQDRCLIGTWKYAGGGSVEWMSRNVHMVHVSHISQRGINISFRADGSFATGDVDVRAAVVARNGEIAGTGHAGGQTSGRWSASGGHFNLCPIASSLQTSIAVSVHGRSIRVAPHLPTAPTKTNYACSATTLTTIQPIAGREPIVTTYARAR